MALAEQVLPLVGVLLGAAATYVATSSNERSKARRDLEKDWRSRKAETYMSFLIATKRMRLVSAQMAAALDLDSESDPIELSEGVRRLVAADDDRGVAYEFVNVYGGRQVIESARALNRAVWGLEWLARERHPTPTSALWRERGEAYASAVDDFIEAVRHELNVPGEYYRRTVEYPHVDEQRFVGERRYRRFEGEPKEAGGKT